MEPLLLHMEASQSRWFGLGCLLEAFSGEVLQRLYLSPLHWLRGAGGGDDLGLPAGTAAQEPG